MHASLRSVDADVERTQAEFVAVMPRILAVARYRFRRVACPDRRDDCVCEAVALCRVWYARLVRKGRDPSAFVTPLARYGVTAVAGGRKVCGQESATDVLSGRCQRRWIGVRSLPDADDPNGSVLADALHDNTRSPVPDQVQFRHDFPSWTRHLPVVKRQLVGRLALGHRTKDVAAEFGLSEGRVSQLRREFFTGYAAYCAGWADDPGATSTSTDRRGA